MAKIIEKIIGDLTEKKAYRENEKRAKNLPVEYAKAYTTIKHYLWNSAGIYTIDPLVTLVDMFEEAAANNTSVSTLTGPDVAAFADELVRDEDSYRNQQREKLNKKLK